MSARKLDLDRIFREALAHHQGGRLADAERLYRSILKAEPKHFDSLHLLGVAQAQSGRHGEALRHMDAAVKINPRAAPVLNNRGNILKDVGRLDDALASYDAAIAIRPDYADAHANRGHVLLALRRQTEALASYDRALDLRPSDVERASGAAHASWIWVARPKRWRATIVVALVPTTRRVTYPPALFATRWSTRAGELRPGAGARARLCRGSTSAQCAARFSRA